MGNPITSGAMYKSARIAYKEPISLLHFLYNLHCDNPKDKIPSIKVFQQYLTIWFLKSHKTTLMKGCLTMIKNFDQKFAYKK